MRDQEKGSGVGPSREPRRDQGGAAMGLKVGLLLFQLFLNYSAQQWGQQLRGYNTGFCAMASGHRLNIFVVLADGILSLPGWRLLSSLHSFIPVIIIIIIFYAVVRQISLVLFIDNTDFVFCIFGVQKASLNILWEYSPSRSDWLRATVRRVLLRIRKKEKRKRMTVSVLH